MADEKERHFFANDGSDWTSSPDPVDRDEKREADEEHDKASREGQGPKATNGR